MSLPSDLSSLSRRELVALAKQYGIPARGTSKEIAENLSALGDNQHIQQIATAPVSQSSNISYLLFGLLVAAIASSVYFYLQMKNNAGLISNCSEIQDMLTEETRLYEKMIDEMGNEKLDLITKIDMFKEKKELAESAYEQMKNAYTQLKEKHDRLRQLHPDDAASEAHPDPVQDPPRSNDEDDDQHRVYCWMDELYGINTFVGSCIQKKTGDKDCPFTSKEHAISELKLHPEWIKLQQADRCSKERKSIIRQLSIKLHPDKMHALGCPIDYGHEAILLLNSMRCPSQGKDRED